MEFDPDNLEPGASPLVCEDINELSNFFATSNFSILTINIRSIQANWNQLVCYLDQMASKPKVIVLSEIWFSPHCDYATTYRLPGYNSCVSTTTFNKACGVLVYTAEEIDVSEQEEWNIEGASAISTKFKIDSQEFSLISMYRSHVTTVTEFVRELKTKLQTSSTGITIFTGDINLNIFEANENVGIAEYYDFLNELGFVSWINVPTRENSCLDHIMVKAPGDYFKRSKSAIVNVSLTDHFPVAFAIETSMVSSNTTKLNHTIKKTDSAQLCELMKQVDWSPVFTQGDVNQAFNLFLCILQNCIELCTICVKPKGHNDRKLKPWITAALVNSINNRDKMAKKVKLNPNNILLREKYVRYRNKLKYLLDETRNDYFARQVAQSDTSAKLWKTINSALGKTGNDSIMIKKLICDGEEISDPEIIASKLNEYFTLVGKQLNSNFADYNPFKELPCAVKTTMSLRAVSEEEIYKAILSIKGGTGPGWDGISSDLIKHLSLFLISPLTHIVNLSILHGQFPDALKIAVVRPLYKKGTRTSAGNYRPISLLSNFAKILEKVVKSQLLEYLEANNLLSPSQYGFRQNMSTQDALADVGSEISNGLHNNNKVIGIFIDLTKAFDSIEISRLILKLRQMGLDNVAVRWFTSYLSDRQQFVKLQNVESTMEPITYGVPQGSVLGPILFLIHINDLFSINIGGKFVAFADDVAIIVKEKTWQQAHSSAEIIMGKITRWFATNSLTINISKTKYILFSINLVGQPVDSKIEIHQENCNTEHTTCTHQRLEQVSSIKYLGLLLDQHMKWKEHIQNLVARIRKTFHLFVLLRSWLSRKNLRMVFYAFVYSILIYGIPIWGGAYASSFGNLEVVVNTVLRIATKSRRRTRIANLYEDFDVLSPRMTYVYRLILHVHKSLNLYEKTNNIRPTRANMQSILLITRPTNDFFTRQLPWLAPALFENLPSEIKTTRSVAAIKKLTRQYLMNQANVRAINLKFKF